MTIVPRRRGQKAPSALRALASRTTLAVRSASLTHP
ncbi:MAG: hypothetical protein QOI63_407 [Thermoplasmata archaeon]|nr:hypothetical protein [Thermoplasmata archaeon]